MPAGLGPIRMRVRLVDAAGRPIGDHIDVPVRMDVSGGQAVVTNDNPITLVVDDALWAEAMVEETVIDDVITMHVPDSGTISIPGGLLPRQEDERNEAMRRIADALNLPRGLRDSIGNNHWSGAAPFAPDVGEPIARQEWQEPEPSVDWSTGETQFHARPIPQEVSGYISGYITRTDGGTLDLGVVRGEEIVREEDVSADGDPEAYEDAPPPDPTTTPIGEGWWENPEGRTVNLVDTITTMVTNGADWTGSLLEELAVRRRVIEDRIADVQAQRRWLERMARSNPPRVVARPVTEAQEEAG